MDDYNIFIHSYIKETQEATEKQKNRVFDIISVAYIAVVTTT